MNWRGIAWDIDGTLVDSEPLHHRALVVVCERYGLAIDPADTRFVGIHIGNVWAMLKDSFPRPVQEQQWHDEIRSYYAAHADSLRPIDGAVETVTALAHAGIAQICVSNSDRMVVDVNLAMLGIRSHLVGSISLDDVKNGKPDPEPYLAAIDSLALPSSQILAVEDSATGVRAAQSAGLKVAFLATQSLEAKCTADFRLKALPELLRTGVSGVVQTG